ncbi:hypothetical protein [Martelella mediterranea]|uniref:Uncharacterized protein n=1 Tax=Martelella mediterranea TaxID=293089 RepID=A0A4R3NVR7_9HYPH|nr:hypothetical protein [Martelella mediterranea]TCT40975.1 hypothetical protein EDC90_1008115 [Martelella mediterranea]
MDGSKKWYFSKTVWGALIAVAAPLLQLGGVELDPSSQGQFAELLVALTGAVGGLLALFGRVSARSRLSR